MDYRKPSDRKSMHSRIVQELGMQIVSGRFKPDDKLPAEALLCEEYAVSRPVLREATRVLVAKGLVYSRPRVGTVVKARREWHMLDPDVLHWLMQSSPQNEFFNVLTSVRSIIEPAAAALAAQFATDADIAAIGEAYQRMEAAPTPEALLQPDLDFHSRIADATHNDLLANLCNMLAVAIAEALKHSNQRPNLHELALPRHKAVQLSDTPAASFAQQWQDEAIAARQQALKTDVENFYLRVIDHGGKLSALDYLTQQQLEWDSEIWLYQIIAEYQDYPKDPGHDQRVAFEKFRRDAFAEARRKSREAKF